MNNRTLKFIEKATIIYENKYDYSKSIYINNKTKVIIICTIHGEFNKSPDCHINRKQGCPKCGYISRGIKNNSNTEQFIERAIKIHGNKYDYSKVDYKKALEKIIIICKIHGEFNQQPNDHLQNHGCMKCSGKYKPNTIEFIEKAIKVHGNKYDYSKVIYTKISDEIIIICKIHGEFVQVANNHINLKNGCSKCAGRYIPTTNEFIEKAIKVHGNKYNYNKVHYIDSKTKIIIICPNHGEFIQIPNSHLQGNTCSKCYGNIKSNIKEFIDKAIIIHNNKYNYLKSIYTGCDNKLLIICPLHGEFFKTPIIILIINKVV